MSAVVVAAPEEWAKIDKNSFLETLSHSLQNVNKVMGMHFVSAIFNHRTDGALPPSALCTGGPTHKFERVARKFHIFILNLLVV